MMHWKFVDGIIAYQVPGIRIEIAAVKAKADRLPRFLPEFPKALPGASPLVLWEWTQYKIIVTAKSADNIQVRVGDDWLDPLGNGVFQFQFRNRVGSAIIHFHGLSVPDLAVEVLTQKLGAAGEPESHARAFRQLQAELVSILSTLVFDLSSPTAQGTLITDEPAGPLYTYYFLRRHGERIVESLHAVAEAPHRVLAREQTLMETFKIRRLGVSSIQWGIAHPATWVETPDREAAWAVASNRYYIPGMLLEDRAEESFDTHENRFVKYFVDLLARSSDNALALARAARRDDLRLHHELMDTAASLHGAAGWWWMRDVGDLSHMPDESLVIHRMDGYQFLYNIYPEYLFGRTPFAYGLEQCIASRNVAELYEYWCFLKLVATLSGPGSFGTCKFRPRTNLTGGLRWSVEAEYPEHNLRVTYNREFHGGPSSAGEQTSYSVEMRPDIVVSQNGKAIVVFDAKFRFTMPPAGLREPGAAEYSPESDDLRKMHSYRDALKVRAAVVLYPGDQAVFYDQGTAETKSTTIIDLITDSAWQGVGAIPLAPEAGGDV